MTPTIRQLQAFTQALIDIIKSLANTVSLKQRKACL